MNYFFHGSEFAEIQVIILSEEESHHALKVLRLDSGQNIEILNGKGQEATAKIIEIKKKQVVARIEKVINTSTVPVNICIALGMLKKRDRIEWFIEKAVELGIQKIILFSSDHSEKTNFDLRRIEKIAIGALKQSGNLWLPQLMVDTSFNEMIKISVQAQKFIAYCSDNFRPSLKNCYTPNNNAMVIIGPEGDFSAAEIKIAIEAGYQPISLGALRLRSETAALAAAMSFKIINEN